MSETNEAVPSWQSLPIMPGENKINQGVAFLCCALSFGPRTYREICGIGEQHHISDQTIQRAATRIGVVRQRVSTNKNRHESFWQLPAGLSAIAPHLLGERDIGCKVFYKKTNTESWIFTVPFPDLGNVRGAYEYYERYVNSCV